MKKIKIGYMYDMQVFPPKGGNHRHAYELTKGFLEAGHEVHVVGDPTMPGAINHQKDMSSLQKFMSSIDILYVRVDSRMLYHWEELKICSGLCDDVPVVWEVNSSSRESLAFSWLGNKWKEKENILIRAKRYVHALRQMPRIIREEKYRKKLAKKISHAVCVSSAIEKYVCNDLLVNDTTIICNGGPLVEVSEIFDRRKKRRDQRFTIVYTGSSIYPWQGLSYLRDIVRIAEDLGLEFQFKLAVNQMSEFLPSGDNVKIYEKLDEEAIRDLICTSDVCFALIPEWSWEKYGFHGSPTKIFEYMALMAPVITSNHGQMSQILKDHEDAILCDNDPNHVIEALLELQSNKILCEEISRNAWWRVQRELNWGRVTSETINIFSRILSPE